MRACAALSNWAAQNTKLSKPLKLSDNKVLAAEGTPINDALKAVQDYKAKVIATQVPDFHVPGRATDKQKSEFAVALAAWKAAGSDQRSAQMNPAFAEPDPQLVLPNVDSVTKPPLEIRLQTSRYDRIVVSSAGSVVIYPVGSNTPLGSSAELSSQAKNLAWIENNASLLVWSDNDIVLLDGQNAAKNGNSLSRVSLRWMFWRVARETK